MKITWKEGKRTLTAEGTPEDLASHIAYLTALDIKWQEVTNVRTQDTED